MIKINDFKIKHDCYAKLIQVCNSDLEQFVICSFSIDHVLTKKQILIDHIIETPVEAILAQSDVHIRIDPRYIKYTLRQFINKNRGIIYCHNHLKYLALFSKDDIKYGEKLIKTTSTFTANQLNGMLVISNHRYSLRVYNWNMKKIYGKLNSNIKKLQ